MSVRNENWSLKTSILPIINIGWSSFITNLSLRNGKLTLLNQILSAQTAERSRKNSELSLQNRKLLIRTRMTMPIEHKKEMLRLDIGWIARAKNVESTAVFLRKHGFTMRQSRSLTQPGGIKLVRDSSVQRICEAAACTPNDLFRFTGDSNSHLAVLNVEPLAQPSDLFKHLTQAEVDRMMDKAKELTDIPSNPSVHQEGRLWLNVARLVLQRQPSNVWSFLRGKGFSPMEARKLVDPKRNSFKVSMLYRLCLCFTCLPNDLFDWEGSETHHLNVLQKEPVIDLQQLMNTMTPQEARRFLRQIRKD